MKWIKVDDLFAEVSEEQLAEETFDIDFGGEYMIRFLKHKDKWIVLNAMNGYGHNCLHEFEKTKVFILKVDESDTKQQPSSPPNADTEQVKVEAVEFLKWVDEFHSQNHLHNAEQLYEMFKRRQQ